MDFDFRLLFGRERFFDGDTESTLVFDEIEFVDGCRELFERDVCRLVD